MPCLGYILIVFLVDDDQDGAGLLAGRERMTFNLSEKIGYWGTDDKFHIDVEPYKMDTDILDVKDVKEFIRLLKEELKSYLSDYDNSKADIMLELEQFILPQLAGDKLK